MYRVLEATVAYATLICTFYYYYYYYYYSSYMMYDGSLQGASEGPWIQTEHVAVMTAVLVSYLAYTARSHLLS